MNEHLNWRYATKKFDPNRKISQKDLENLTETLRLAPSSFGLQPWKFVIVKDPQTRQRLKGHAWNQPQVTDASDLFVLCALTGMDEQYIRDFIEQTARQRGIAVEGLKSYEDMMSGFVKSLPPQDLQNWMKRQVYIALGMLLSECAHRKIDACPMEGFDGKKVDEVLGLAAEGLTAVAMCPVGYRASDDLSANAKKVRFDAKDVFIYR